MQSQRKDTLSTFLVWKIRRILIIEIQEESDRLNNILLRNAICSWIRLKIDNNTRRTIIEW